MSGVRLACSIANHRPVPAEAGLDLVDDQERPAVAADALGCGQERGLGHVDTALALDDLEDHGGGLAGDGGLECRGVVERHVRGLQQRREALSVLRLPRDRQCAEGPSMEAPCRRDERRAAGGEPGELQRAVDRFRAAIAEKRMGQVRRQHVGQRLGEARAHVVVEIVGAEGECVRLAGDGFGDRRMAVTEHRHALRGAQIEVALPLVIGQPAALAADEHGLTAAGGRAAEEALFHGRKLTHSATPPPAVAPVRTCPHPSAPARTRPHPSAPVRTCYRTCVPPP